MAHDLVFRCPECRQWLEAPPDAAGLLIECPKCEAVIRVPEKAGGDAEAPERDKKPPRSSSAPLKQSREEDKSSTIRINLPPGLGLPPPPSRRRYILRRPS